MFLGFARFILIWQYRGMLWSNEGTTSHLSLLRVDVNIKSYLFMKTEIRMKCISYSLWEESTGISIYGIHFMGIMSRISDDFNKYNIILWFQIDCIRGWKVWVFFIISEWEREKWALNVLITSAAVIANYNYYFHSTNYEMDDNWIT